MKVQKVGSYTTAFVFDEIEDYITAVFLIEGESRLYLLDTFCGPDSMQPILEAIDRNARGRELAVINTHFHWDHVWGNCSFIGKNIYSHVSCRETMDKMWEVQISQNRKYLAGAVEKQLPNITFEKSMVFEDDGIELFHSPGHTGDSISVFDHRDGTLYAGDNLERPIVYVEDPDIQTYISTLGRYQDFKPKKIAACHTLEITDQDLQNTAAYLRGLLAGDDMHFDTDYENKIHKQNLSTLYKT